MSLAFLFVVCGMSGSPVDLPVSWACIMSHDGMILRAKNWFETTFQMFAGRSSQSGSRAVGCRNPGKQRVLPNIFDTVASSNLPKTSDFVQFHPHSLDGYFFAQPPRCAQIIFSQLCQQTNQPVPRFGVKVFRVFGFEEVAKALATCCDFGFRPVGSKTK